MKRIRKVFFAWQMEQEKAWLETMAKQGFILKKVGLFKYFFEQEQPVDLVYQFDFQILNKETEEDYLSLFQDWTLAAKFGSWYYFYKPSSIDEKNEIYMDNTSKRSMFRRLLGFLVIVAFPLYYQIAFTYPRMDPAKLEYPNFYFFMRIIVIVLLVLWAYAFIRILLIARQFKNNVRE